MRVVSQYLNTRIALESRDKVGPRAVNLIPPVVVAVTLVEDIGLASLQGLRLNWGELGLATRALLGGTANHQCATLCQRMSGEG